MSLNRWYVDLRSVQDHAEYIRIFDLLNDISEGRGLVRAVSNEDIFTCLLDSEESSDTLRALDQYLSPRLPEK